MRVSGTSRVLAVVASGAVIIGGISAAHAATGTWAGAANATWDTTSTNWTTVTGDAWDAVNGPTNVASFTASANVTLGSTVFASSITPAAGAQIGIAVGGTDDFTINAPWTQASTTGNIINKTGTGKLTLAGSVTLVGSVNSNLNAGITVADGGELVLTGALKAADSLQSNRGNFTNQVGATTSNNVLRIAGASGTTVYMGGTFVGSGSAGNNSLYITRPGTLTTPSYRLAGNGAQLQIGGSSANNYVEISNGAYLYAQQGGGTNTFRIGANAGADGNELRITGAGSTMDRSGLAGSALNVGEGGSNNRAVVTNGGTLIPRRIGIGTAGGDNNYIHVTGAGSLLNLTDSQPWIEIGRFSGSTGNYLLIENGGTFNSIGENQRGYMVGPVDGSDGNYIRVSGTGSTFTLRQWQPLAIGGIAGQNNGNNSIIDSTAANNRLDIFDGARANQGGIYLLGVNSSVNLGNGVGISELEVRRSGTYFLFRTGVVLSKADSRLNMNSGRLLAGLDNVPMVEGSGQVALVGTGYFHTDQLNGNSADAVISGTGGLVKQGTGTLRVTGTNTFSGGSTISAGTLSVSADANLGDPFGGLLFDGGTLEVTGTTYPELPVDRLVTFTPGVTVGVSIADSTHTFTASQIFAQGTGGLEKTGPGTLALSGQSTYTGPTTVSDGVLRLADGDDRLATTGTIVVTESGILDVGFGTQHTGGVLLSGGTIRSGTLQSTTAYQLEAGTVSASLAGSVGAVKSGFGSVLLSGANTYAGATTISAGTLELGEFGTLGAGSYSAAIANDADLVVSTSADQTLAGAISGTGRLVKAGFGRLTLTGTNTYSGTTTVSGGTLLVNGTNAGAGLLTTSFGTILGGSGRIAADTTVGGLHSPGNSPGVQTFGSDLTYTAGTTVLWELAANADTGRGTLFDGIDVEGNLVFPAFGSTTLELNFASSGNVDWSNGFWGASRQWVIYDVAGSMTDAANLSLLTDNWMDASGQFLADIRPESSFTLQTSPATGEIILNYTAPVPEPAVLGVAGIAATAFVVRRLWRRRRPGRTA